jgi:hypothetical protein
MIGVGLFLAALPGARLHIQMRESLQAAAQTTWTAPKPERGCRYRLPLQGCRAEVLRSRRVLPASWASAIPPGTGREVTDNKKPRGETSGAKWEGTASQSHLYHGQIEAAAL